MRDDGRKFKKWVIPAIEKAVREARALACADDAIGAVIVLFRRTRRFTEDGRAMRAKAGEFETKVVSPFVELQAGAFKNFADELLPTHAWAVVQIVGYVSDGWRLEGILQWRLDGGKVKAVRVQTDWQPRRHRSPADAEINNGIRAMICDLMLSHAEELMLTILEKAASVKELRRMLAEGAT